MCAQFLHSKSTNHGVDIEQNHVSGALAFVGNFASCNFTPPGYALNFENYYNNGPSATGGGSSGNGNEVVNDIALLSSHFVGDWIVEVALSTSAKTERSSPPTLLQ